MTVKTHEYCSEDLVNELERRIRSGSNLYSTYNMLPQTVKVYVQMRPEYCTFLRKGSERALALQNPNIVSDEALMWEIQTRIINGSRLTYSLWQRMFSKLKADPPVQPGKRFMVEDV
jgi:hypothetical protein